MQNRTRKLVKRTLDLILLKGIRQANSPDLGFTIECELRNVKINKMFDDSKKQKMFTFAFLPTLVAWSLRQLFVLGDQWFESPVRYITNSLLKVKLVSSLAGIKFGWLQA